MRPATHITVRPRPGGIDVHELLKREVFDREGGPAACDAHFEKSRPCPAGPHGISDQYVVLDSFCKLRESDVGRGEFRWNFMVQGVTGDQVVGVRDTLDNVIEIQLGAFTLPIPPEVPYVLQPPPAAPAGGVIVRCQNNTNPVVASTSGYAPYAAPLSAPTLVPNAGSLGQYPAEALAAGTTLIPWVFNPYSQLPFGGRLTVQIREAGLQSFSDLNGARHHFELAVGPPASGGAAVGPPAALLASPVNGGRWDSYIFTEPLKDLHGATLVFRNPDTPVAFLPDVLYGVGVAPDSGASPGPYLRFSAPGHGLAAGDRIFISDFASGRAALDAYVGRPEGHVVNGDPASPLNPGLPLPGDTFWLDPAVSTIDMTLPALPPVRVFIAKRRLRIPLRVRRVVARTTNYISP